jgi:hypothetical protein
MPDLKGWDNRVWMLKIVIASEAKQSTFPPADLWIASSLALLAMTARTKWE